MQAATANITAIPNKPTFESLLGDAKRLGADRGRSKDAQLEFDMMLFENSYKGTLSLDRNRHGTGRSDAVVLSEAYVRAANATAKFDPKGDSEKRLVSNANKLIEVGSSTKWGRGQPMAWVQDFVDFWRGVRSKDPLALKKLPAGKTPKELNDVHNALMRLLTVQKRLDTLLPDNERNLYAFKTASQNEDTEVTRLEAARKALQKCQKNGDRSKEVADARDLLTKRLADIAKGVK